MNIAKRLAVHTIRIAAITAELAVMVSAVGTAATARLIGWELRQLASSPLSADVRRPDAGSRELVTDSAGAGPADDRR